MKFTIETSKSKNEIIRIIKENTREKTSIFDLKNNGEFFKGKVFEDSFKIERIIHYRNSFLPVIIGNIEEIDGGCKVNINMRLNIFAIIFFPSWILFAILSGLFIPISGSFSNPVDFLPLLAFSVMILILFFLYRHEIKKSKEKLEELLNSPRII